MQSRKKSYTEMLGEMITSDENIKEELKSILASFQELGFSFKESNLDQLKICCEEKGLTVQLLNPDGVGNNKNILITSPQCALIIQLCSREYGCVNAMEAIMGHTKNIKPEWLYESYYQLKNSEERLKEGDRSREIHLTVMNAYPNNINKLAMANRDAVDSGAVFSSVAKVAAQLSNVLSTLAERDVIWTDMKPGNILFDENDDVKIADTKGFSLVGALKLRTRNKNIIFDDLTAAFLSSKNQDRMFELPESELKNVIKIWEKEYSYQLAIILYRVATGDTSDPQKVDGINKMPFNFDAEIFKSEEGGKFKNIIQKLSAEDPQKRMSFQDAARQMGKIVENADVQKYEARTPAERLGAYLDANSTKEKSIIFKAMKPDERGTAIRKESKRKDEEKMEELRKAGPEERKRIYLDSKSNRKEKILAYAVMMSEERKAVETKGGRLAKSQSDSAISKAKRRGNTNNILSVLMSGDGATRGRKRKSELSLLAKRSSSSEKGKEVTPQEKNAALLKELKEKVDSRKKDQKMQADPTPRKKM